MPQLTTIISQSFLNQFYNGDDLDLNLSDDTINLAGNTIEKIKVSTILEIEWRAEASAVDVWTIPSTIDRIERSTGNFFTDGFYPGQIFLYIQDWLNTGSILWEAEVSSISEDGRTLIFTNVVGGPPVATSNITLDAIRPPAARQANHLTALIYKFGLIGNDETLNFNSKLTEEEQVYYGSGIGEGVVRPTTFVDLLANNPIISWKSGTAKARFVSEGVYTQRFEVEHTFVLLPFYRDGEQDNITNRTPIDIFEDSETVKYVFEGEFRLALSNPNTSITAVLENTLGSVGWFDENFNGFENRYNVVSVSYQDTLSLNSVEGLQLSSRTTATIEIERIGSLFLPGQRIGIAVCYLPSAAEYTGLTTDFNTNFRYDILFQNEGFLATGTGIIKEISSVISSGNLIVTVEFEYNASQALGLNEDSQFLISAIVADPALSSQNSDRVSLLVDSNNFVINQFLDGLLNVTQLNYLQHDQVFGVDSGSATIETWNEDGILLDGIFNLDLSREAEVSSISFKVVAYNATSGNFFELDSFEVDLSAVVVSSGIQQIEIDQTRGYKLAFGDQFNYVRIQTGALIGSLQNYSFQIGQKIPYQDWIPNPDADTVFFDNSQPNNNLNFKASNYSGLNNYIITVLVESSVSGLDELGQSKTGISRFFADEITVYDYEKDSNSPGVTEWSVVRQTLDPDNLTDLGLSVSNQKDTLFRCTWTNTNGPIIDLSEIDFAIHRLEIENNLSNDIEELSSINAFPSQILKPLTGETQLKVSIDSGNVVTECLIDYTKLSPGTNYKISERIENTAIDNIITEDSIDVVTEDNIIVVTENN